MYSFHLQYLFQSMDQSVRNYLEHGPEFEGTVFIRRKEPYNRGKKSMSLTERTVKRTNFTTCRPPFCYRVAVRTIPRLPFQPGEKQTAKQEKRKEQRTRVNTEHSNA